MFKFCNVKFTAEGEQSREKSPTQLVHSDRRTRISQIITTNNNIHAQLPGALHSSTYSYPYQVLSYRMSNGLVTEPLHDPSVLWNGTVVNRAFMY
jgi:hypothetical protein